jgi:hypothetical protein
MATSPFLAYAGGGDKPTAMGNAMPKHRERDEFDIVLYVVLGLVGIAVAMGLIEWNARRNAAAFTREVFRPPTAAETRAIEQQLRSMEAESAREVAKVTRRYTYPSPNRSRRATRDITPLAADERCISGQRFRRLSNGWQEIGTC